MTVNISEALRAFVQDKIASGQYASVDEVIEAALLELQNIETGELDKRWLNAKIESGIASLDLDGGIPADEAMKRMRRYIAHRTEKMKS